ncbi:MAG: luxQ 14, partial [Verrucomicrobia bacterium]|nr:luxQ 14 [Verrucomicrobiota bacterium]
GRQRQYEARNLVQALRESGERLKNFYESSHDCIKELDLKGRILSINMHGQQMLGGEGMERFHLKSWPAFWKGKERQNAMGALKEARLGRVSRFQGSCLTFDGIQKWWDVILSPILNASGKPQRVLAVSRDVTEGRTQQEALALLSRKIEDQARIFDTTLSHINDFAYILDRRGRFLYANKPLLNLWGLSLEEAVGKDFFDLHYSPELAARFQRQIQQVFATKETLRDETPYKSPSGTLGYYEYIFNPVIGPDGTVTAIAGSTRDVTERKRHEADLAVMAAEKEAQARLFDATLSSITDLAYTFDLEGNWIYANKPLLKLWGKSLEEISGKSSCGGRGG